MNSKLIKILYIVAACFLGLGVIYYLGRIADQIFVRDNTAQWLLDLNTLAIVFIAIGVVIIAVCVLFTFLKENKQKEVAPKDNTEILQKYKSKKK